VYFKTVNVENGKETDTGALARSFTPAVIPLLHATLPADGGSLAVTTEVGTVKKS
jgi:hypothetical protein